jgi:alkanesulfonate monooxygenase SsuD/methylene tetrahydromethanopterin reductase-like flavin-dependent oxidoreductase (luciferase family)
VRFGIELCTLGAFADPRETMRVAVAAEAAGWEALLVWDHLAWASMGVPSADPWVTLGACAAATDRILLGTGVTPLPRRRPQVVAQQLASLSLASGGRVIFGVGNGVRDELERFGEDGSDRRRGALLDEGLAVVARLLSGERVDHRGPHYVVDDVALAPLAVRPIPIWVGGDSRAALERAAAYDGWLADGSDQERNLLSPADVRARIGGRELDDVCFIGYADGADLDAYADAGVTWWLENMWGDPAEARERVAAGPPGR